jgi:hypothetical protein
MVCQLLFINKQTNTLVFVKRGFVHCDRMEDVILMVHLSVHLSLVKADSQCQCCQGVKFLTIILTKGN